MCLLRKPFSTSRVLLVLAALLVQAHVIRAAEGDALASVPDDAAQAQAVALIREVYEQDYETAKTSADRTALAKKMIDQARQTVDDPVARFVLLRVGRDMAVQAGDAETAVDAVDRIAQMYDVDGPAMKADALVKAAVNAKSTEARKAVAEHSLDLVHAALNADDYATAKRLADTALAAARRVRDGELVKKVMASRAAVTQVEQAFAEVRKGLDTLNERPTDPEANLAVGRYYALVKGNWEKGVPMLALSGDEPLRTLAQWDLRGAATPREQVDLADAWWELAESSEGQQKTALLLRAGAWYRQARDGLSSGLARVRVDKRLEVIAELGRPHPTTSKRLRLPQGAVLVMTFEPDTFGATGGKAYVSDLSGANNHGLLQNGPTPSEGKAGAGLKFDGKNDHILLPTLRAHLVRDLKGITISMWVNASDAKEYGFIFDVGHLRSNRGIGLVWCGRTALYQFDLFRHRGVCVSEIVQGSQWRHLVARWDGSRQSFYLGGKLHCAVPTSDFALTESTVSVETARIGGQAMSPSQKKRYFNGFIDEVAIFPRALSEDEIQTLHQMGSRGEPLQRTRRGKLMR